MNTLFLSTDSPETLACAVAEASRLLGAGEPVALPTETVYGLAADALRPEAVLKIFEAKERPFFDPLIVHLPDLDWLDRLATVPAEDAPLVRRLTGRFWPGPLTLVLPRRDLVPDLVASGLPTVALRMSAHPVFRAVGAAFGRPLAAPSANRFGRISPTAAEHVLSELAGRIPLVVDGGATVHGVESTIVAIAGGRLEILRSGPITREELAEFGEVTAPGVVARPVAPGQLKSHYAPRTPLQLSSTPQPLPEKRCGLLAWKNSVPGFERTEILSAAGDLREAATHLFAALRRLDEAGLDLILAEPVPETGLGVAIMDRLRKAAHEFNSGRRIN
ncbi:MAG: L-threonylcarbamoyladenylate synthase [Verrucomicrobia bacterium]|nr:L-threonylcarbamoyladenylate synthase [Verrucomicrobiota bacterium]